MAGTDTTPKGTDTTKAADDKAQARKATDDSTNAAPGTVTDVPAKGAEEAKPMEVATRFETPGETAGVSETQDAKTDVVAELRGMDVGEHTAQKFANNPENPQPAPGLDPELPQDKRVRMEITDSDHPDPANPKVTYVDPVMVGDYLRTGWRRAS